jgi:hypothetical protein
MFEYWKDETHEWDQLQAERDARRREEERRRLESEALQRLGRFGITALWVASAVLFLILGVAIVVGLVLEML